MLTQIPVELLLDIAHQVALVEHGPPKHLIPLLATCKHIHHALNFDTLFYADVFRAKFDVKAIARRLPRAVDDNHALAAQLRTYCTALKHIHSGDVAAESIQDDLWSALFMMLENDGKNEVQLEWAGLAGFVDTFVRTRLYDASEETHGWPAESPINALALWLMWFTMDETTLMNETADARRQLMELVRPYVVLPMRYPISHTPDWHFTFPLQPTQTRVVMQTPHGFWPPYRAVEAVQYNVVHYGVRISVAAPLISTAARLLYFARSEATPYVIPTDLPANRAEAISRGFNQVWNQIIPTQEDYVRFNQHKAAAPILRGDLADSTLWDEDWQRVRWCYDPWYALRPPVVTYVHGSLDGEWLGRMLLPDSPQFFAMVQTAQFEQHRPPMTTVPISMRLREYHAVSPKPVASTGILAANPHDHNIINAWFPTNTEIVESRGELMLMDTVKKRRVHYERWKAGEPNSHEAEKCKMCIEKRQKWEDGREEREEKQRTRQRLLEKKRKSASDSDEDEDEEMDEDEGDGGSDREGRARGKKPRQGRGPSARRESSAPPTPAEPVPLATGMEQVDEVEEIRMAWQRVMGSNSWIDDVLDETMGDDPENSTCDGVQDIIIVGETLPKHGEAWHHYKLYGRVRSWDGLVAMVRVPLNFPELGTTIFRGYLIGNQHFVGSWRTLNVHTLAIPLEGPLIASSALGAE